MPDKAQDRIVAAAQDDMRTGARPPQKGSVGMPGDRAALPDGALSKPFSGPQGDENRTPPDNAPLPPNPSARLPAGVKNSRGRKAN
jgi:hypothetical protein